MNGTTRSKVKANRISGRGKSPTPPVIIEFLSSIPGESISHELADVGRRKWTDVLAMCKCGPLQAKRPMKALVIYGADTAQEKVRESNISSANQCKCTPTTDKSFAAAHFHMHWIEARQGQTCGQLPTEYHGSVSDDHGFVFVGELVYRPTASVLIPSNLTLLQGEKKANSQRDEPSTTLDICDGQHDMDEDYEILHENPNRAKEYRGHEKCANCLEYAVVTYLKRDGKDRVPVRVRMGLADATIFQQRDEGWTDVHGEIRWAVMDGKPSDE